MILKTNRKLNTWKNHRTIPSQQRIHQTRPTNLRATTSSPGHGNDAQALFRRFVSMNHGFKLKAGETCVTNDAGLLNYAVKSGYARVSRKNRTVGQRLWTGEEEKERERQRQHEATATLEKNASSLSRYPMPPMSDNCGAI